MTDVVDKDGKQILRSAFSSLNLETLDAVKLTLEHIVRSFTTHFCFDCDTSLDCQCKIFFNRDVYRSKVEPVEQEATQWRHRIEQFVKEPTLDNLIDDSDDSFTEFLTRFWRLSAWTCQWQGVHFASQVDSEMSRLCDGCSMDAVRKQNAMWHDIVYGHGAPPFVIRYNIF